MAVNMSTLLTWRVLVLLQLTSFLEGKIYVPGLPRANYKSIKDYNIGVLMPVHAYSRSEFCNSEMNGLGGLQRIEAIDFAINEINEKQELLQGHKLGYIIFDDCSKDVTALAQALRFRKAGTVIKCEIQWDFKAKHNLFLDPCSNDTLTQYNIIGVIGSETSSLTVQVANMLTAFKIPHISYMSSSAVLSDKAKYPYFMRPIPSDLDLIQIIIDILVKFNWSFVSVIYTEGPYGTRAFNTLRFRAERINICFAETYEIGYTLFKRQYSRIVDNLVAVSDKASVVIVIAYYGQVRTILENYNSLSEEKRNLTWIATDTWGVDVIELINIEHTTVGMLSINIKTSSVPRFNEHFVKLVPTNKTRNPWFHKYWEKIHGCTLGVNRTCSDDLRINDSLLYQPDKYVSEVFHSVYTYAHALDGIFSGPCQNCTDEDLLECVDLYLLNYMRNVNFQGENSVVRYDNFGDGLPNYEILNMQDLGGGKYQLKKVGYYNSSKILELNESDIQWVKGSVPRSRCSEQCTKGQQQRRREAKCCWDCQPCEPNQIVIEYFGWLQCQKCKEFMWPASNRTVCVPIIPRYLRWDSSEGIAITCISGFGIVVSISILIMFIVNNQNPLIKSCGRELSYLMLVGIIFSYSLTFAFLGRLNDIKCTVNLYGFGLSFASIYSPLLTKTNRIYRIFQAGKKTRQRPPLIESRYQVSIALLILGILVRNFKPKRQFYLKKSKSVSRWSEAENEKGKRMSQDYQK